MKLRPYQLKAIADLRMAMAQIMAAIKKGEEIKKGVVLVFNTGAGKTVIASEIIKSIIKKGKIRNAIGFIVHRKELMTQTVDTFKNFGMVAAKIEAGGKAIPEAQLYVGMIQSMARKKKLPKMDIIVVDESHLACAKSYLDLFKRYPEAWIIGLTATPTRLSGEPLGEIYSRMVIGPSLTELIKEGSLVPSKIYSRPLVSRGKLKKKMGEFTNSSIDEALEGTGIFGDAVDEYLEKGENRKAVAFLHSVEAAHEIAEEFLKKGVAARALSGKTPKAEREAVVKLWRSGEIRVVCNVGLFVEGLDVPDIGCVILLRPTASLVKHRQSIGRGLRPAPGKENLIILDHVGSILDPKLGHPEAEVEWSLEGKKGAVNIVGTMCPKCFSYFKGRPSKCANCGEDLKKATEGSGREGPQTIEGKLQEIKFVGGVPAITPEMSKLFKKLRSDGKRLPLHLWKISKHEERRCKTMTEFVAHAKRWGLKNGWIKYQAKSYGDLEELKNLLGYSENWLSNAAIQLKFN